MFTAHIFFCVMLAPVPECAIADDTRGPYEVEEKCVARLGEMQSALEPYIRASRWWLRGGRE